MRIGWAIAISATVSAAIGVTAGYILAKKHLDEQYEVALAEEIKNTRQFYAKTYKKDEFETPESFEKTLNRDRTLINNAASALVGYGSRTMKEVVTKNIFDEKGADEPDEAELRSRTEEAPYIISATEFSRNETEYVQDSLTYYSDGILVDSQEEIVVDEDDLVGIDNLKKFGHLSQSPHLLYIRNDAKEIEFEITLREGEYSEAVGLSGG